LPEAIKVPRKWLSPYQNELIQNLNKDKFIDSQKLIPNLNDKERYVLHY